MTLFILTGMTVVARLTPWKPWPLIRTIINAVLALGVGLITLLYLEASYLAHYMRSPWLLSTLCLVWLFVLVLTHIHSPPWEFKHKNGAFSFLREKSWTYSRPRQDSPADRDVAVTEETEMNTYSSDTELRPTGRTSTTSNVDSGPDERVLSQQRAAEPRRGAEHSIGHSYRDSMPDETTPGGKMA